MAATFEARFQATANTPFDCDCQHPHLPPPGPCKMYEWSKVNQCWQCQPCGKLVSHGHLESAKHKRWLHSEMLEVESYASAATATTSGAALTNRLWEPVPAAPGPPPGLPTAGLGTQPHAPSLLPDWRSYAPAPAAAPAQCPCGAQGVRGGTVEEFRAAPAAPAIPTAPAAPAEATAAAAHAQGQPSWYYPGGPVAQPYVHSPSHEAPRLATQPSFAAPSTDERLRVLEQEMRRQASTDERLRNLELGMHGLFEAITALAAQVASSKGDK